MQEITDENLPELLIQKEERALEYLIERYGGLIKSIVRKQLYAFSFCWDECINDILLSVWSGASQFQPEKNTFANWLAAVCKYKCIDYKRKYMRQWKEEALEIDVPDPFCFEETLVRELSREVEEILKWLPEKDRILFSERYLDGLDIKTLAKRHDMLPSAIYNRLSKGRKKLRKNLL